jgi:polysaccharide biosynthesis/export protein
MKARLGLMTLGLLVALTQGPSTSHAQSAPEYRIGIDDVLAIYVWDNKDTDQTVFVRPDGKISLPLAGEVEVRGMTVGELESRLTELYQRTIKAARVTVIVREIRSRPIFFVGGVNRTGPMQLIQDWTLLQAVSAAGGPVPQADLEAAYVLREGRTLQVNFDRLIQRGDITQNIKVQPGDVIVIPLAEQVFVEGDVKKPGSYKYTRDLTLFELITQAGGFPDLTVPRKVTLVRTDGVKKETVELNAMDMVRPEGGGTGDMRLRPKDLVVVTIADLVYVQGEVKSPTTLKYTTDLTLLKAIAHTGGFTQLAAGNRVVLVRGSGAKRENVRVNVDDMLKGNVPDIALNPNDIVIVPQRLF